MHTYAVVSQSLLRLDNKCDIVHINSHTRQEVALGQRAS
jgi:hypothetical protein